MRKMSEFVDIMLHNITDIMLHNIQRLSYHTLLYTKLDVSAEVVLTIILSTDRVMSGIISSFSIIQDDLKWFNLLTVNI